MLYLIIAHTKIDMQLDIVKKQLRPHTAAFLPHLSHSPDWCHDEPHESYSNYQSGYLWQTTLYREHELEVRRVCNLK